MLNRSDKIKKPAIAILLIGLLLMAGVTVATYIMKAGEDGIIEADRFYFTSNYLKDEVEHAVYYIDPKYPVFDVQLYNYEDSKRKASTDIQYTVSASGGAVGIGDTGNTNGTLKKDEQANVIKVKPSTGENHVVVTAASTAPYTKSLTAEFKLENGNSYTVTSEGDAAAVLTMTCRDAGKDITISLPQNLVPDASDDRVKKGNADNEYSFTSNGYGVYTLVLLKKEELTITNVTNGVFADRIEIKEQS